MIRLLLFLAFIALICCDPFENGVCLWKKYSCGPCLCQEEHRIKDKYFCDCQHLQPMKDCVAFRNKGYRISGVYILNPRHGVFIQVFCDQVTDGGGWIVFQRRLDGSINFYRDWGNYKTGFGAPQHEFWLGNDHLSILTSYCRYHHCPTSELRIEMKYWIGQSFYAKYSRFSVGNAASKYKLHVSGYSGNIGDSGRGLSYHNGKRFSTFDKDNDSWNKNCAKSYKGGWWYGDCHTVNLNGRYLYFQEPFPYATGLHWHRRDKYKKSMYFAEMKFRRKNYRG